MPSSVATQGNEKGTVFKDKELSDDKEVKKAKLLCGQAKSKVQAYEGHPLSCYWDGKDWMCVPFVCASV